MGFHRYSQHHPATMENFPDEILSYIFIRLPAKQLAQMRCLSKSWNAQLSESSFIQSHLNRSIQNNKNDGTFLVFYRLFSFASKPFTAHPYRSPHLELPNIIKLPVVPHSNNSRGKIIGSVNGLICFKYGSNHDSGVFGSNHYSEVIYGSNHDSEVIYIWNPSLTALLTLPPSYIPSHSIEMFFRFGFDPKTDDYKVVKITRRLSISPNTVVFLEWLPVEVFSMRKGSWKLTTQRIPSHVKGIYDFDGLCVDGHDGHLHWVADTSFRRNHGDTILAFDLGEETFLEIPFPSSLKGYNANYVSIKIGILAGKLCVMSRVLPDGECEVWLMDEYGVAESWVKRHVFPLFSIYPFPLFSIYPYGFTAQNELLFKAVGDHPWYHAHALYDPLVAKTKIFKLGNNGDVKVVDYVDSLVWVTPVEQRERS